VAVAVLVAVLVVVIVDVLLGVCVEVTVGVLVGVFVGVFDGVWEPQGFKFTNWMALTMAWFVVAVKVRSRTPVVTPMVTSWL
jgi:hypothetical protein